MPDPFKRRRVTVLCLCLLLPLMRPGSADAVSTARPNFLVIFTDDQGIQDVGCYGSEIPTPNIDSLARDGLKFNRFYSASSICTPSRFGLLTGRHPSRSRDRLLSALMFLDEADANRGLRDEETTLAEVLRAQGYETALIGKWHLGHGASSFRPERHGFDRTYGHTAGCVDFFTLCYGNTPDWYEDGVLLDESGYATDLITDRAVRFLDTRSPDKPFFLFLPYNAPHFGKGWDDGRDQTVNLLQPHPRDLARVRFIQDPTRRKYAAMVAALDDGIGRVLSVLDRKGLAGDTLVLFMTDHGGDPNYGGSNLPLRAGKATLFEGGVRIPCLARWPGVIPAGTETETVAWTLDWFPTLCALADITVREPDLDGIDLSAVLRGNAGPGPREFFWELGSHAELDRGRWLALRQGDWKYVDPPGDGEWLFDLGRDPGERVNLAERLPDRLTSMRTRARTLQGHYRGE